MISFLRVLRFAIQDIVRNMSLSLMTIFILTLMLLSINTLVVIQVITSEATALVKDQIDVSIFFSHEAQDEEITEVQEYLQLFPEVNGVEYISREDVYNKFKSQYADNDEILASLEELGENPLGPTMIVSTREPGDYPKIIEALQVPEYQNIIEAKTFGDTEIAIERIDTVTTQVERFSLALSILFAVIAFLIIFNTIRVAIYTHRTEISIKKLVGATNWFVRGPYLVEAFFFTIVSIAISSILVWLALQTIDPYVGIVFEQQNLLTNYFQSNILMLLGWQFGAVLALTIITSALAMQRHLRV